MENASFGLDQLGTEFGSGYEYWNFTANNGTATSNLFDDYPQSLLYFGAICCIAFTVIGVPGNLLTIVALLKTPKLRNATSAFIINLCFADAFYCGFSLPLAAATFIEKRWPYGDTLCTAFAMIRYMNAALSLLTVVGITINRYVIIVHPKRYGKLCTKLSIGLFIALLWIIAAIIVLPTAVGVWGAFQFDPDVGTCSIVKVNGKSSKTFIYGMAFGVPSAIFLFCYARIFFVVRKSERRLKSGRGLTIRENEPKPSWLSKLNCFRNRKEKTDVPNQSKSKRKVSKDLKLLRVIMVIFLSYIICFFPVSFVKILRKEKNLHALNVFGYVGAYFSACVNPIIYVVMSKEYRRAYKNLWFCSFVSEINSDSSQQRVTKL